MFLHCTHIYITLLSAKPSLPSLWLAEYSQDISCVKRLQLFLEGVCFNSSTKNIYNCWIICEWIVKGEITRTLTSAYSNLCLLSNNHPSCCLWHVKQILEDGCLVCNLKKAKSFSLYYIIGNKIIHDIVKGDFNFKTLPD